MFGIFTNVLCRQDITPKPLVKTCTPKQRPICLDPDCVWFCRLVGSIVTIALCYACAYAFISDTKLKFGLFVP
ncbi:hypothetical protein KGM_205734 [Danaus plexippus plexippus]|uniref:Uncharacterized protein n=1 Tax=Danaus plexippus plexippus TaxID=278856 RepID=A0A212FE26_DANPL|nr:hypothetical protein KGM_205734 [Danaus plexippus plexippus]